MTEPRKSGNSGGIADRITPRTIMFAVVAVLSVWFILANTDSAKIHFWIPTVDAPMWLVLVGTFLAGWLASWLFRARKK